jgi:hypothetical protein
VLGERREIGVGLEFQVDVEKLGFTHGKRMRLITLAVILLECRVRFGMRRHYRNPVDKKSHNFFAAVCPNNVDTNSQHSTIAWVKHNGIISPTRVV